MKRALALLLLATTVANAQYKDIYFDDQSPGKQHIIDRVFSGNTPFLRFYRYDHGVPSDVSTNWTFSFKYNYDKYDTNGMVSIPQSSLVSNSITFHGGTNVFFEEYDSYYWSLVGTHNAGYTKTWAIGTMIQDYDPAAGDPSALKWRTTLNWDYYSYTGVPPWISDTGYFFNAWIDLLSTQATLQAVCERGYTTSTWMAFTTNRGLHMLTVDGNDHQYLTLSGGGTNADASRGAFAEVSGNERDSYGGWARIAAGNVPGGRVRVESSNALPRLDVTHNGDLNVHTNEIIHLGAPQATDSAARLADAAAVTQALGLAEAMIVDNVTTEDYIYNKKTAHIRGSDTNQTLYLRAGSSTNYGGTTAGAGVILYPSGVSGSKKSDAYISSGFRPGATGDVEFALGGIERMSLEQDQAWGSILNIQNRAITNVAIIYLSDGGTVTSTPVYSEIQDLADVMAMDSSMVKDITVKSHRRAILMGTTDGADTNHFYICWGHSRSNRSASGASIFGAGNEAGPYNGNLYLASGNITNGRVVLASSNILPRLIVEHSGDINFLTNKIKHARLGANVKWIDNALPVSDNTIDIGSSTNQIKAVWLHGTLYIGGEAMLTTNGPGHFYAPTNVVMATNLNVYGWTRHRAPVSMQTNALKHLAAPVDTNDAARLADVIDATNNFAINWGLDQVVGTSNVLNVGNIEMGSENRAITAATADDNDNQGWSTSGGGLPGTHRGAGTFWYGNEHQSWAGDYWALAGQGGLGTNGRFIISTSNEQVRLIVEGDGAFNFNSNVARYVTFTNGSTWTGNRIDKDFLSTNGVDIGAVDATKLDGFESTHFAPSNGVYATLTGDYQNVNHAVVLASNMNGNGQNITNVNIIDCNMFVMGSQSNTSLGASGTDPSGTIFANGWATTIGDGGTSRYVEAYVANTNVHLGGHLTSNWTFTGSADWWALTNAAYSTSTEYTNRCYILPAQVATFTPTNAITILADRMYLVSYYVNWFADVQTNDVVIGGNTNRQIVTSSGRQDIYIGTRNAQNLTLTVRTANTQGTYVDNITVQLIGEGDLWADEGRFRKLYGDGSELTGISGGGSASYTNKNASNTVYVGKHGLDANSGLNWGDAKLTVQAGIDAMALLKVATGVSGLVRIGEGIYAESVTVSNGVSLKGGMDRNNVIQGSITVPAAVLGTTIQDLSLQAIGSVGAQFIIEAGASTAWETRLRNVAFVETVLSSFTASPVQILGGRVVFDNVTFAAPSANFNGMGVAAGAWMVVTNDAKLKMRAVDFEIDDMANTNVSITMIRDFSTGKTLIQDTTADIIITNSHRGRVVFYECGGNSAEKLILGCHIDIEGTNEVGVGIGILTKNSATVRASGNQITVIGFTPGSNMAYHAVDTSTLTVNGADDVADGQQVAEAGADIPYTGSSVDRALQIDGLMWGKDGRIWTDMPDPSGSSGHSGTGYVAFGQHSEFVSGTDPVYNNVNVAADGSSFALLDHQGNYMNLTMTITNWSAVDNDGENAAGTLFPQEAVRGNIKNNADGSIGRVDFTGATVGETYVLEILGSAANGAKPCDDMLYWMDNSNTQMVDVINNTDVLAYITNVATASTMTLYCSESNGVDPYLNAFRISGPAALGYLRLDGQSTMTGDLDMGTKNITNGGVVSATEYLGSGAKLTGISASGGSLWGSNANGQIYYRNPVAESNSWLTIGGSDPVAPFTMYVTNMVSNQQVLNILRGPSTSIFNLDEDGDLAIGKGLSCVSIALGGTYIASGGGWTLYLSPSDDDLKLASNVTVDDYLNVGQANLKTYAAPIDNHSTNSLGVAIQMTNGVGSQIVWAAFGPNGRTGVGSDAAGRLVLRSQYTNTYY